MKKKIIINAIFIFVMSFVIGIPLSLWTITIVNGKEKPAQGNTRKSITKAARTVQFMSKRQ
jgi:hypothetical protein